jgi:hypothetical protein
MARPRSWTDDDLRAAVAGARSWREVRDRLGLRGGGSANRSLRERAATLGLSIDHLPGPGASPRRFTDAELAAAVAAATSLHGVFVTLGLAAGGSAWLRMQEHIQRLGLDTSHWRAGTVRPGEPGPRSTPAPIVPAEDVRGAMKGSRSIAEAMRRCGLDPTNGSAYGRFVARLEVLGIPRDQVPGQLRLDHVNGDPRDNRAENLRLLCANCDALTATYCGRHIGRRRYSGPGGHGSAEQV